MTAENNPLMSRPALGVVLAGGTGTRLLPATRAVSKHLLPVYDTPMVRGALSVLLLGGLRDIVIVTAAGDRAGYERCVGDGSEFGCRVRYAEQARPRGVAEALLAARDAADGRPLCVVLGDAFIWGAGVGPMVERAAAAVASAPAPRAVAFAARVDDGRPFGVVRYDEAGRPTELAEKPRDAGPAWAVIGLYAYTADALDRARTLTPSARGELEITDLNRSYLERGELKIVRLPADARWRDVGTPDDLLAASMIAAEHARRGERLGDLETIARARGWIEN